MGQPMRRRGIREPVVRAAAQLAAGQAIRGQVGIVVTCRPVPRLKGWSLERDWFNIRVAIDGEYLTTFKPFHPREPVFVPGRLGTILTVTIMDHSPTVGRSICARDGCVDILIVQPKCTQYGSMIDARLDIERYESFT